MEAALTAAGRGHSVTLYEKNDRLGGALLSEQYIPFKQDMYNFVKVMEKRIAKAGVKVCLNTALTPEQAEAEKADVVVVAVGAEPIVPPIPGIDGANVVGLDALHQNPPALGQKVVILGGGLVGSESAIYLDGLGKDVTVVEMKDDWAADAYFMHKNAMKVYVKDSRIQIKTGTTAKEVTEKGLVCKTPEGEELLEADTILLAAGMKPDRSKVDDFYNTAPRVFQVGDCIKAGRVVDAVTAGYYRAIDI
ncbi:MAG: NAD(P)/FAD-dependent oxidoreductase [Lachnospiraceae bacterium]|nr:NAD(P)/FAD-dependent oxidoreductase [Lachnospiraceae bacterium]